jgi:hypothetical protein
MTADRLTLAVTGHRPGRLPASAPTTIRRAVRELVAHYPDAIWVLGGALGADQLAVDELLELDQRVELVLPFVPDVFTARWAPAQRVAFLEQIERVAKPIEIIRTDFHVGGYHERNRRLVERADLLVAFWDSRRRSGGTASTVFEAMRRGVPVHVVPLR